MSTVVVSGRVDEAVKRRADAVLAREGKTPADVIRDVWITISITGKLPDTIEEEERFKEQRRRFAEFMQLRASLPPLKSPEDDWLIYMTDEEMNDFIATEMLKEYEAL